MNNFFQKVSSGLRLFKKAFKGYIPQMLALTVIGFLSGLLEGVGANALIPLFSFVTGGDKGEDFISKNIENFFGLVGIDFTLSYLLVFIAALFVLKAVVLFIGSYIQLKISYGYEKNNRTELFKRSLESRWSYLLEQKIGHLEKVLSVETRYVTRLLETLSSFILISTSLIVFIVIAINISASITLITIGTGAVLIALFHPLVETTRRITEHVAQKTRDVAHFVNENILGVKTIKAMSVSEPIALLGDSYFELLRKLHIRRSLIANIFGAFFQPFSIIFILLLFAFSYKTGDFNLPAFVALIYLIQRIFSQVQNFQTHTQTIFRMFPYLENVLKHQEQARSNKEEDSGTLPFAFNKNFSFKNVSFAYGPGKETLSHVSFSVPRGSFVGLIGPSGAGKTTIVDIALRLFKPTEGDVLLDDTSIYKINLHHYRKNVGYVSQDIHLTNDTVARNIAFFDESITENAIVRAAKQANIYEVIQTLPHTFNSVVGERGVLLSAGQRQRVVIARVLARNPQFLILDEATSALDNESEKRIQEVIENLKGKITVLVIAHRLSTVMNCDTLFVLDQGKIIEQGKPQDLLQDKETYFYKTYHLRE